MTSIDHTTAAIETLARECAAEAHRAIADSAAEDRVIRLPYSDALHEALLAHGDDSVETETEVEHWGTTDEGSEWRVHLTR